MRQKIEQEELYFINLIKNNPGFETGVIGHKLS